MENPESGMEQAIQNAGYQISDTPPPAAMEMQQDFAPVENITEAPASENVTEVAPVQQEQPQDTQEPAPAPAEMQTESGQSSLTSTPDYSFADFLEALGGETPQQEAPQMSAPEESVASNLDPRIQVIADFVSKTGRNPEDWFRYQALEPSEMDDRTVMRVHLASEYPSLGNDEIDLLINSKYRTDDSVYSDDEVRLASLQLKIDAQKARESINTLRNEYMTPILEQKEQTAVDDYNPFDETWMSGSAQSLQSLEKISFDLPGGKEFHYGVPEQYRNELRDANSRMADYFDRYLDDQGNWDHDLWNMHRTVTDNLPSILQNIYRQGLSDGQRTIVEKAANIEPATPQQATQRQPNSVAEQVLDALGRRAPFLKNF